MKNPGCRPSLDARHGAPATVRRQGNEVSAKLEGRRAQTLAPATYAQADGRIMNRHAGRRANERGGTARAIPPLVGRRK
ncbi:MAG: hypothetical protein EBR82_06000 [Caulobacteraceae bacterium]|nr:hypothetical protein [Caulobacteraceae bacterium]